MVKTQSRESKSQNEVVTGTGKEERGKRNTGKDVPKCVGGRVGKQKKRTGGEPGEKSRKKTKVKTN